MVQSRKIMIGKLAGLVIQNAMESGLSWDESIASLGVAAKALASKAHIEGCGSVEDCHELASMRFNQGFDQQVEIKAMIKH